MTDPTAERRLRPGHHLYQGSDGCWRLWEPGDRFTTVRGPQEVLAVVQGRLTGDQGAGVAEVDHALVDDLERALDARGVLRSAADEDRPESPWTVLVSGCNPVGRAVAHLLEPIAVVRLLDGVGRSDVQEADTVVACAGWLPDARWQELDGWCAECGTDWHMSYLEGATCYVGPMCLPGVTASYRDTRARRLAAAAHPEELRGLWSYLDAGLDGMAPLPPVPWPQVPGAMVVAGLLVGDLLSRRWHGRPASDGHQLAVDLATATVVRHPVLPLPRTAPAAQRFDPSDAAPAAGRLP